MGLSHQLLSLILKTYITTKHRNSSICEYVIHQLDICHFFPTSKICGSILVEQIFQGAIFAFDMNFFTEQTFSPQTPTNIRCAINRYLYL